MDNKPTWYNGTRACIGANLNELTVRGNQWTKTAEHQIMNHIESLVRIEMESWEIKHGLREKPSEAPTAEPEINF